MDLYLINLLHYIRANMIIKTSQSIHKPKPAVKDTPKNSLQKFDNEKIVKINPEFLFQSDLFDAPDFITEYEEYKEFLEKYNCL